MRDTILESNNVELNKTLGDSTNWVQLILAVCGRFKRGADANVLASDVIVELLMEFRKENSKFHGILAEAKAKSAKDVSQLIAHTAYIRARRLQGAVSQTKAMSTLDQEEATMASIVPAVVQVDPLEAERLRDLVIEELKIMQATTGSKRLMKAVAVAKVRLADLNSTPNLKELCKEFGLAQGYMHKILKDILEAYGRVAAKRELGIGRRINRLIAA